MADGPPPKRSKGNGPVKGPDSVETYEITHRLEFYYTETEAGAELRSPPITRLFEVLHQACAHLPNLPMAPFYICPLRTPRASFLTGGLHPWSKDISQKDVFNRLPVVGDVPSLTRQNFSSRNCDLIRAFVDLREAGRADLFSTLTVYPSPTKSTSIDFLDNVPNASFMIAIDIRVTLWSLDEPADLSPLVSEAQRRILCEMFPRSPDAIKRKPTVSGFIANLQPAPPLPSPSLKEYIQPAGLQCQLLPFQQRSVFWMLNREGFTISNKGEVIPASSTFHLPPLWEQVSTQSGTTRYLNRLEGQLRKGSDLEGYEPVKGGILAEEVGCGKTVESIALILLNSPANRGPWNVEWNDLAQIPLHEVKVNADSLMSFGVLTSLSTDYFDCHTIELTKAMGGGARTACAVTQGGRIRWLENHGDHDGGPDDQTGRTKEGVQGIEKEKTEKEIN